jgi:predicted PurR-regulated permease PerM
LATRSCTAHASRAPISRGASPTAGAGRRAELRGNGQWWCENSQRPAVPLSVIAAILTVGALYVARAFFIPLALALGLHALLRPLVRGLERLRIPTPLGAALIVLGALATGVTAVWSLSGPVVAWVEKAPASFATARTKLSDIARPLDRLTDAAVGTTDPPQTPPRFAGATSGPPLLARLLGGATALVLGLAEVIVLLYLMLAAGHLRTASELLPDTESIVARYLALSSVINGCEGIAVGIVMWAIGMPDPLVWGLLTFGLEFIPYLGAATMVGLLTITGLTTFPSVGHALVAPISYLAITTLQNNVLSPFVYAGRLKLNPLAVMVCVLFWWFVWGIPGVFLAIPIAATLKALGDQVPRLAPLGKFLGSRGAPA